MIKKIGLYLCLSCLAGPIFFEFTNLECMQEKKKNGALIDVLPPELITGIVSLACGSSENSEFNEDFTQSFQFNERKILNTDSHEVSLETKNFVLLSNNFNTAEIDYINDKNRNHYGFVTQCSMKNIPKADISLNCIEHTIVTADTIFKGVTHSPNTKKTFFEGPTSDGFFILAMNAHKKVEHPVLEKKESSCFPFFKKTKHPQSVPQFLKHRMFKFYLGKLSRPKNIELTGNYDRFLYQSTLTIGALNALAIAKSVHDRKNGRSITRFALASTRGIFLYQIKQKSSRKKKTQKCSISKIGQCSMISFKKISFLTPQTLLGITYAGNLFCIAHEKIKNSNELWSSIDLFPYILKDKNNKQFKMHTFAVNPVKPYQLVLCTDQHQIIYLNLKNCLKEGQKKTVKLILNVEKLPSDMWFYETNLCLGYNQGQLTHNYILADFDLTL